MENSFFMWQKTEAAGAPREVKNTIKYLFMQTFFQQGVHSDRNFYVVLEWGALDSNTISSVICWSCQQLFGENCGNLFHYLAFPSRSLPASSLSSSNESLYIKHAMTLVSVNLSTNALVNLSICDIHIHVLFVRCKHIVEPLKSSYCIQLTFDIL